MDCTGRVPKAIVGIHVAIVYFSVVRAVINRFPLNIELIELTGEEQCPVKTEIEGA